MRILWRYQWRDRFSRKIPQRCNANFVFFAEYILSIKIFNTEIDYWHFRWISSHSLFIMHTKTLSHPPQQVTTYKTTAKYSGVIFKTYLHIFRIVTLCHSAAGAYMPWHNRTILYVYEHENVYINLYSQQTSMYNALYTHKKT